MAPVSRHRNPSFNARSLSPPEAIGDRIQIVAPVSYLFSDPGDRRSAAERERSTRRGAALVGGSLEGSELVHRQEFIS